MTNEEAIRELSGTYRIAFEPDVSNETRKHNEAIDLATDALREQAERDKGCEYCKQVIATVKMDFETDSILGENKWFSSTRRPKYCPMCGKRLGKRRESEVSE